MLHEIALRKLSTNNAADVDCLLSTARSKRPSTLRRRLQLFLGGINQWRNNGVGRVGKVQGAPEFQAKKIITVKCSFQFSAKKVKVQADGRTICRHRTDIFLVLAVACMCVRRYI